MGDEIYNGYVNDLGDFHEDYPESLECGMLEAGLYNCRKTYIDKKGSLREDITKNEREFIKNYESCMEFCRVHFEKKRAEEIAQNRFQKKTLVLRSPNSEPVQLMVNQVKSASECIEILQACRDRLLYCMDELSAPGVAKEIAKAIRYFIANYETRDDATEEVKVRTAIDLISSAVAINDSFLEECRK